MKSVAVFMSTYNGEKYLQEQIDCILNQVGVQVYLYIRDDGSTDSTISILEKYSQKFGNIFYYVGENKGFERSFAEISRTTYETDYYAYADQDDYWMPNKLICAINKIENENEPCLYGGNIEIVNSNLERIRILYSKETFGIKKEKIMHCNPFGATPFACTMVWNKKLQKKLCLYMPQNYVSHDVYICMLCGYIGEIILDEEIYIKHRLHDKNTAGIANGKISRLKKGIKLYMGKNHRELDKVATEIISTYQSGTNKNLCIKKVAQYKCNLVCKFKLLFCKELKYYKPWGERTWIRMLILCNCL